MDQLPLITPDSSWSPPTEYPRLTDEKELSWDLETYDPSLKSKGPGWSRGEGHVVGIGVATRDKAWYFPIRHEGGGNLDPKMTLRWAGDLLKLDTIKVAFNGLYDLGWMKREGLTVNGICYDPMGAAALIDENRMSYTFNSLLRTYTDTEKDMTLLKQAADAWGVDPVSGLWKLPSMYAGFYGEWDAAANWKLFDKLKPMLEEQDMWDLFLMEMQLYPVWLDMTWRGVRIDELWIEESREKIVAEIKIIQKKLKGIDVWNANDIGGILEDTGIQVPKTQKTKKYSITADWLKRVGTDFTKNVLRNRRLDKVLGTFLDGMIIGHLQDGRIHPDWHPMRNDSDTGIVSGRVSASNPSPQVFPKRDPEFGLMVRGAFLPEEGEDWVSADQAQQEPRWFVHYAGALGLSGVDRMLQAYQNDPETDYHTICANFSGLQRKPTKDLNQGFAYGMGRKKSEKSLIALGVSPDIAPTVYDTFHREFPYVKELTEYVSNMASQRGWVKTILGRRFHFDLWEPEGNFGEEWIPPVPKWKALRMRKNGDPNWKGKRIARAFLYKSTNRIIQGSSADQIKKAMLDIWNAGGPSMLLQIHDELNISNSQGGKGVKLIQECMEDAIKGLVPFKVDVTIGERWMNKKED